jgi:hypothetical protein
MSLLEILRRNLLKLLDDKLVRPRRVSAYFLYRNPLDEDDIAGFLSYEDAARASDFVVLGTAGRFTHIISPMHGFCWIDSKAFEE